MAQLHEEILQIKVSKLVKDNDQAENFLTDDTVASLEAVVQELAGSGSLVEIHKG